MTPITKTRMPRSNANVNADKLSGTQLAMVAMTILEATAPLEAQTVTTLVPLVATATLELGMMLDPLPRQLANIKTYSWRLWPCLIKLYCLSELLY